MKNLRTLFILLGVLIVSSSCKKDKDNANDNENKVGSYTYQSKTTNITLGDYRDTGENGSWIFFTGAGSYSNAIQLRFPNVGVYVIPTGTFKYNALPYNNVNYKPASNFNGGTVTTEANVLGDPINGGDVTIKKEGNGYTISFDVTTAKGPLKGSFSGSLKKI